MQLKQEGTRGTIGLLTSQVSSSLLLSHSITQPGLCDTRQDRFGMEQQGQGWADALLGVELCPLLCWSFPVLCPTAPSLPAGEVPY